jgi:hypothetical protein
MFARKLTNLDAARERRWRVNDPRHQAAAVDHVIAGEGPTMARLPHRWVTPNSKRIPKRRRLSLELFQTRGIL